MKRVLTATAVIILTVASTLASQNQSGATLIEAARTGDAERVRTLLSEGMPPDTRDLRGVTALAHGAYNNHPAVVRTLLQSGADPSLSDRQGRTPWTWAAARGGDQAIAVFLEAAISVNDTIEYGVTALMLAARQGHTSTVTLLLEAGADPRLNDDDGDSAMQWARNRGHGELARLIDTWQVKPERSVTSETGTPYLDSVSRAIVAELNWVRTDPKEYAEEVIRPLVARFDGKILRFPGEGPIMTEEGAVAARECYRALRDSAALSALAPREGLSKAAASHARDQGPRGALGHTGSDGSRPRDRIERYETDPLGTWGENVAYGWDQARRIVFALLVDDGVPGRGHRKNIMNPKYTSVGISVGEHARYGAMCVMDFAAFR